MRIGFDAKRLFNNFTGLGNYSRFVVDALHREFPEHEYVLFTPSFSRRGETAAFQQEPFQVHTAPGPPLFRSYWRSVALAKAARQNKVDVLHGLSNELPLRRAAGLPMVCTVHDLIFERYPHLYSPIDRAIYRAKMRHVCRVADRIIAISVQTARDLEELFGVDATRIRVVYQGCAAPFYEQTPTPVRLAVREKYRLPDQYILLVGTLEERKNAALLLRALAAMKSRVPVVFVGRKTGYQPVLDELIRVNRLESWVRFLNVDYADLPAVYQLADVFVYPSRYEGFGIPIVEAIASGVPVITTRGGVFAEAGGPDSWYVDPDQPEEMAAALTEILGAGAAVAARVSRTRSYINRFSSPQIAQSLMQVYREVV